MTSRLMELCLRVGLVLTCCAGAWLSPVSIPLCNSSFPFINTPAAAVQQGSVLLTSASFLLTRAWNSSRVESQLQPFAAVFESDDSIFVASRVHVCSNATLKVTAIASLSTSRSVLLPTESGSMAVHNEQTGVNGTFDLSIPSMCGLPSSLSTPSSRDGYVPVLAASMDANASDGANGWIGGVASTAMMPLWVALFAQPTQSPWPASSLYAGLDWRRGVREEAETGTGQGTESEAFDAVCRRNGLGVSAGSLRLGELHHSYDSVLWSELVSKTPLLGVGGLPPLWTSYMAAFTAYRPSVCGVDLSSAMGATGHWLAEVDTASSCTVLPADMFDVVTKWMPLVNCPPSIAASYYPWQGRPRTCDASSACGYSSLDSVICDIHPNASQTLVSGLGGLPVLTFLMSEPQPGASVVERVNRTVYMPMADLVLPRALLRGPRALAELVPGLSPDTQPTHSLCLVRGQPRESFDSWQPGTEVVMPFTTRIRIGTLALASLYVAWELSPPIPTTTSNLSWADLVAKPMRPKRVGLAAKAATRERLGLDTGRPRPGFGIYAQCTIPAASSCRGAQVFSALENACMRPSCGTYTLQSYDEGTGTCVMTVSTAAIALTSLLVVAVLTVYLHVLRFMVAARALKEVEAARMNRLNIIRPDARHTDMILAQSRMRALAETAQDGSSEPAVQLDSDPASGEAAFSRLCWNVAAPDTEAEGGVHGVRRRRARAQSEGSNEGIQGPGRHGLPRTWGTPFSQVEPVPRVQLSFQTWLAQVYPSLSAVAGYVNVRTGVGIEHAREARDEEEDEEPEER